MSEVGESAKAPAVVERETAGEAGPHCFHGTLGVHHGRQQAAMSARPPILQLGKLRCSGLRQHRRRARRSGVGLQAGPGHADVAGRRLSMRGQPCRLSGFLGLQQAREFWISGHSKNSIKYTPKGQKFCR